MKSLGKLLFLLLFISACSTTDEGILCETGPVGFTFEVLDEATAENIFANGMYEVDQLQIKNDQGETVEFRYEPERDVVNVLLGWESKSDIYSVSLGEEIEFDIVFTLNESSSGGCTSTKITELEIAGATYEKSESNDVTTIFVSGDAN